MKKTLFLVLITALSFSCVAGLSDFRNTNRINITKLSIGMSKDEAKRIMGTQTASGTEVYRAKAVGSIDVSNPYRTEILQGKGQKFELWLYYTDIKKEDGAITDDELTPLLFDEKGKLLGWGWSFFEDSVQKYEIRIR